MDRIEEIKALVEGNYTVQLKDSPSYIHSLFMPHLKGVPVVLVYDRKDRKQDIGLKLAKISLDESSFGEIGGSPLPAPFTDNEDTLINISSDIHQLEDLSDEENHSPIPLVEARRLLSYCNLYLEIDHPIWVVTEGEFDLLSSYLRESGRKTVTSWAKARMSNECPTIKTLSAAHFRIQTGQLVSSPTYSVEVSYDMTPLISAEKDCVYSQSTVLMSWTSPCVEPPSSRRVSVITKTKIGHGGGPIRFLWEQLVLIQNYLELLNSDESKSSAVTFPSSANVLGDLSFGKSSEEVIAKINKAFEKRVGGVRRVENDFYRIIHSMSSQNDIKDDDLISNIWLALISCNNSNELFACLYHLSILASESERNTLHVVEGNMSQIGQAITKSSRLQLNPSDWKSNVKLLVELGLEKVRNDLSCIFGRTRQLSCGSEMGALDLPSFTQIEPSAWLPLSEKWLGSLTRLHCSLELIYATHSALQTSSEALLRDVGPSILKAMFKSCPSAVRDIVHLVSDPLLEVTIRLASPVHGLTNQPTKWMMTITSNTSVSCFTSVFYFGPKCPFPWYKSKLPEKDSSSRYFVEFQSLSTSLPGSG